MQGSFEKKLQEKLDELRLTPNPPVWEKVELRIRPEKKRRRGLFWFIAVAGLLAGGWWLFSGHPAVVKSPFVQTATPVRGLQKEAHQIVKADTKPVGNKPPVLLHDRVEKRREELEVSQLPANNKQEQPALFFEPRKAVGNENHLAGSPVKICEQKQGSFSTATDTEGQTEIKPGAGKPITTFLPDSTTQIKTATNQETLFASSSKDSTAKKVASGPKKWSRKFLFGAGWSSVAASTTSYSYAAPTAVSSSGAVTSRISQPQKATRGSSFSVGYAVEKTVSNRLALTAGLQYAFYSTHQTTGVYKSKDTAVRFQNDAYRINGYYSNAGTALQTDYTNRFHVAELPVRFRYCLLKQLPLCVSAGASYGRLLSSNALTYDAASGVSYVNSQNNRKNYLNLFASFQYTVVNSQGWKLGAGPVMQYNLVGLQKVNDTKPHLFFTGLKAFIEF